MPGKKVKVEREKENTSRDEQLQRKEGLMHPFRLSFLAIDLESPQRINSELNLSGISIDPLDLD